MKKKKLILFLLLIVVGVCKSRADNWTLNGWKHGTWGDHTNSEYKVRYDNYSWADPQWAAKVVNDVHTSGDQGFEIHGTSITNTIHIQLAIYSTSRTIPSYSKLVRTATFEVWYDNSRHDNSGGLYLFNDEYTAKNTYVDATYRQTRTTDEGENYKVVKFMQWGKVPYTGGHDSSSDTKTLTYDNSNVSTDASISKWAALSHCVGTSWSTTGSEWVTWLESQSTDQWYYYKHITFDANGGAGTMDVQTIENSGTLTANAFTRTGYTFAGWNTKADGTGTNYDAGATMTATSTDKGLVTLYAQWTPCVANAQKAYTYVQQNDVKIDKLGTAAFDLSGSPTVEFDENGKAVMKIGENKVAALPMSDKGQLVVEFETTVAEANQNKVSKTFDNEYATIYSPFQLAVPASGTVEVYAPTYDAENHVVKCNSTTQVAASAVIPTETALLLKNAGTIEFAISAGASTDTHVSSLSGSSLQIDVPTVESGKTLFTLGHEATETSKYGFFKYTGTQLNPGLAWLVAPSLTPAGAKYYAIVLDDEATSISELRDKSLELRDGKYIENGRVVVVKNGKKYNLNGQAIW